MFGADVVKGKNKAILRAVMNAIIPRGGAFASGAADYDLIPRVNEILRTFNPLLKPLIPIILIYIQFSAFFHKGRLFTNLPENRAIQFLNKMELSPLFYRRFFMLLLKMLTMMTFYEKDENASVIGYTHGCHK